MPCRSTPSHPIIAAAREHENICPATVILNPAGHMLSLVRENLGSEESVGLVVPLGRQQVQLASELSVSLSALSADHQVWRKRPAGLAA
jgi:hypothetical protein